MERQARLSAKCSPGRNRPRRRLPVAFTLAVIAAVVLAGSTYATAAAAPKSRSVEIIQQKHCYLGNLELMLAPDAVRISENVNGTVVTSKAPDWRVFVYNKRNKLYYDMSLEVWKKHGLRCVWVMMAHMSDWPIVKTGSEKLAGRDADIYTLAADPQARAKLRMHKPIDFRYGQAGEFFVDKAKGPKERAVVVVQLYKVPEVQQIPLSLKIYNPDNSGYFGVSNTTAGKQQFILQTFSQKRATVPYDAFDLPPGYKRAHDDSEVTISKSSSDSLDSLVRDMGLGERFDTKHQQK